MRRLGLALLLLCLGAGAGSATGAPQDFVIFFQNWSAAFDDSSLNVIARAAGWAKDHPGSQVTVTGAADLTGSKQANRLLSDLRAQVVADQLAEDGVEPSRIKQVGLGSVTFALSAQESRRVVIGIQSP